MWSVLPVPPPFLVLFPAVTAPLLLGMYVCAGLYERRVGMNARPMLAVGRGRVAVPKRAGHHFPMHPGPARGGVEAPWRACPTEPLLPMEWAKTARLARFLRAFCPLRVVVAGGVGRPLRPVEGHAVTGAYGGRTAEKTIKRAFSAHSIGRGRLLVVAVPAL